MTDETIKNPASAGFFISHDYYDAMCAQVCALQALLQSMGSPPAAAGGATENRDGLPMRKDDVGLVAGVAQDGRTTVHDHGKPDVIEATHTAPESGEQSQRPWNVQESHDYHERVEKAELDAGKTYPEAHRVATEAEHARMRQMGFDPNGIEEKLKPYYDEAAHRARALGNTTADVTGEPYQDSGENKMREDGGEPDRRFVLDRDGDRYVEPVHGKLLGSVEVVTARAEDGSAYAVIDPNSGAIFATARRREKADRDADAKAKRMGLRRLQRLFEEQPAMSQQQLREKFGA